MNNPYETLGIPVGATENQVKSAYKNLAQTAGNLPPEQYEHRMKELDNAYDKIMENMNGGNSGSYTPYDSSGSYNGNYNNYGYSDYNNYDDVRRLIDGNLLNEAEVILDGMPLSERNAEWHYLKGRVCYKYGRLENASREFEAAYRAEPSNNEYKTAYENIYARQTGGYRKTSNNNRGCSTCDICTGLICADCCCESMGGDLIPCC